MQTTDALSGTVQSIEDSASGACNQEALAYWRMSSYSQTDVDALCNHVDRDWMAARVSFNGEGDTEVRITEKTWERREGHFPAITQYFGMVARHPYCLNKRGSLVVWLEDGLWEAQHEVIHRAPIISFGRHRSDHCTFLMPDPSFLYSTGYTEELKEVKQWEVDLSWEKKQPTVFWRGAATGLGIEGNRWKESARGQLALYAANLADNSKLDAKITKISHLSMEQQKLFAQHNILGEPCDFQEFLKYRYLIDADGYCCAWRSLFLKLAAQSVVLKMQSDYEQWYFCDLKPWQHYLPLRHDLSNFEELYNWLRTHDGAAQEIVRNAHAFIASLTYEQSFHQVSALCAQILDCQKN